MYNACVTTNRYTEALELGPEKGCVHKLYANRSLAHLKAQRCTEALRDAELTVAAAPLWPKAHWRQGAALRELKRMPEAVAAFHRAWQLNKGGCMAVTHTLSRNAAGGQGACACSSGEHCT